MAGFSFSRASSTARAFRCCRGRRMPWLSALQAHPSRYGQTQSEATTQRGTAVNFATTARCLSGGMATGGGAAGGGEVGGGPVMGTGVGRCGRSADWRCWRTPPASSPSSRATRQSYRQIPSVQKSRSHSTHVLRLAWRRCSEAMADCRSPRVPVGSGQSVRRCRLVALQATTVGDPERRNRVRSGVELAAGESALPLGPSQFRAEPLGGSLRGGTPRVGLRLRRVSRRLAASASAFASQPWLPLPLDERFRRPYAPA